MLKSAEEMREVSDFGRNIRVNRLKYDISKQITAAASLGQNRVRISLLPYKEEGENFYDDGIGSEICDWLEKLDYETDIDGEQTFLNVHWEKI